MMNDELRIKKFFPISYKLKAKSFQGGFSLVEVLVAAAVLIIAVTGTLSIISRNVSSAAIAEERVVAYYLAQEAIEFVRSVRDNNVIANPRRPWLDGLDDCVGQACSIDVNDSAAPVNFCPGGECPLLLNPDGVYNRSNGEQTIFSRTVILDEIRDEQEVRIDVTVNWVHGLQDHGFTLSGHIFNWR